MKKHGKKKINESLPMRNTIDLDKVQQELWELCRDNDVELYFSEVRRIAGGQLGCSFEAVVDNYETVGNLRTVSDYNVSVKIVDEEALISDDVDTIADYIINTVHGKAVATDSVKESVNEGFDSFDMTKFLNAVNTFSASRKQWLEFIENQAKKFIQRKKDSWKSGGWSAEDALVYGLERCDDVSYDGFDITRDEYDELISSLEFYIDNSGLIESVDIEESKDKSDKKLIRSKVYNLVKDFIDDSDDRYWRFDMETSLSSPEDVELVRDIDEIPNSAKYRFTISDGLKDVASFYYDYHNDGKDYGCWYVVDSQGVVTESTKNEELSENWCDEKLLELEVKGRDNWDQDDWETYAYCKNANAERDYQEMKDAEYEMEHAYDDVGDYEIWQMENELPEDDYELDVEPSVEYQLVDRKYVDDSDGFQTEYSWYKDSNGHHVFVFGDSDLYRPEDGEFDWEEDNDEVAKEWFDNYKGFEEEDEEENYWG